MKKLTLKELEELNQINNNEIYRLRRIITQQGKDIVSKDKLISGLAKKVNQFQKIHFQYQDIIREHLEKLFKIK